jgi:hypothetical protein
MPHSNAERAGAHSNRARLLFAWSLTLLLGVVAVTTSLGSRAIHSPPTGPSQEIRSFAHALATGDSRLLDSLLHEEVEHRDLASGAAVRGRSAWEAFFREAYPTPTPSAGSTAEVLSSRLLTHNVAIGSITQSRTMRPHGRLIQRSYSSSTEDAGLSRRWVVAATRAGGNYGTLAHGQLRD